MFLLCDVLLNLLLVSELYIIKIVFVGDQPPRKAMRMTKKERRRIRFEN